MSVLVYKIKEDGKSVVLNTEQHENLIDTLTWIVNKAYDDIVEVSGQGDDWIQFESIITDRKYTLILER